MRQVGSSGAKQLTRHARKRRSREGACFRALLQLPAKPPLFSTFHLNPSTQTRPQLPAQCSFYVSVAAMAQFFRDLRDRSKQLDLQMTDKEIDNLKKENNRRLKQTFDDIIKKYGRDFGNTGDEIDLEKEEIVVNNGHLLHMQHDQDAGKGKRTKNILASLVTGELWDDDVLGDGDEGILRGLTDQDLEDDWEDASQEDAEGETEEDSGDDRADNVARRSLSHTESEPTCETNPTSADDSNTTPQIDESDDGHDPLSREEYSASSKRMPLRSQMSTTPTSQQLTKRRRKEPIVGAMRTVSTNQLTDIQVDQITPFAQTAETMTAELEEPNQRQRKKRRTEPILEIPIWTHPGLDTIPVPKTVWDRHWSRRRNPKDRTFDEKGNQICTWKDIQDKRRRQQAASARHPLMEATQQNRRTQQPMGTAADNGEKIKLEHTCLSEDVASACPACDQAGLCKLEDISEGEAIIAPEVADVFLRDHTCLSGDVAAPCAACEREDETQDEEKEENLGIIQKSGRQRSKTEDSAETTSQIDGAGSNEYELEDCNSSIEERSSDPEVDWENNPDLPRPQYVTKVIKYYSKRKPFTPEEDQIIIDLIENQAKGWDEVMEAIPGRRRGQLQYRYYTEVRSEQWREKQAAAREANKERRKAEIEMQKRNKERQKEFVRAVRDLSGTVFEKPERKSDPKWKEVVEDEDLQLQPLDPCILPPPEDEHASPTFHPTVPLIELVAVGGLDHPDVIPVWRQAPRFPVQIEGVPMEPIPPLDLIYETPYPDVYPHAQYNGEHTYEVEDEKQPEENPYESLPVGLFGSIPTQGPLRPMNQMAFPSGNLHSPYLQPPPLLAVGSAPTRPGIRSQAGHHHSGQQNRPPAPTPEPRLQPYPQAIIQPVSNSPAPEKLMLQSQPTSSRLSENRTESRPPLRSNTESPDPLSSPAVARVSDIQRKTGLISTKATNRSESPRLSSTLLHNPTSRCTSRTNSGTPSEPSMTGKTAMKNNITRPLNKTHVAPSRQSENRARARRKHEASSTA